MLSPPRIGRPPPAGKEMLAAPVVVVSTTLPANAALNSPDSAATEPSSAMDSSPADAAAPPLKVSKLPS